MHRWRSYPLLIAAVLVFALALSRCGKENDDDKDEGSKKPAASPGSGSQPPLPTPGAEAEAPTGWDGLADWNGSDWEVVDE